MRAAPQQPHEAMSYRVELIEACRRGESRALEEVFKCEAPYLERVLGRIVGPAGDVEDLLQASLEAAIRAFPRFRAEASVRTWLTRIAVRTAMAHLRHPSRKRRVTLEIIEGGAGGLAAETSAAVEHSAARERLQILYENLERIDINQRTAFLLFAVEGRSMEEVAALMGARVNATKSRVMWARRRLFARLRKDPRAREWLSDYLGEE